jgi:hypothetical protein
MSEFPPRWRVFARRAQKTIASVALATCLAGCVDEMSSVNASAPTGSPRLAAVPGVSPRGAPLAFVNIEGAPDAILARFSREANAAAAGRDIAVVEQEAAAYLARGYLAAYPSSNGAVVMCVWDIFDRERRRVRRLDDYVTAPGASADPWSLVDDRTIAALAARSMENLAATLTNTPEAIGASGKSAVVAMDPPSASPAPMVSSFR